MSDNKLIEIVEASGLREAEAKPLLDNFGDFFVKAHKLAAKAKGIKVTDVSQVDEMQQAREIRLELKNVRVEANKVREVLKEGYLRGGKAVQDIFNDIRDITKPEEERLLEQEKFAERVKEAEEERVETERKEKLSKYMDDISVYKLHPRDLSTDSFEKILASAKETYEYRKEKEAREEAERVENERKQRVFNDRRFELAPYIEYLPKEIPNITVDTSEKEFQSILKLGKDNKKIFDEDRKKLEIQAEKDRKAREEAEAKLKEKEEAERKQKEKEEAELKAQKEAEAKAKAEAEEIERQLLLAPDKKKLVDFANRIETFFQANAPALKNSDSQKILDEAEMNLKNAISILINGSKKL